MVGIAYAREGKIIAIIHAIAAERGKSCNGFLVAVNSNAGPEVVVQMFHDCGIEALAVMPKIATCKTPHGALESILSSAPRAGKQN